MSTNAELIRVPLAGMMLLTLVVWIVMFRRRIGAIRTLGLNPKTRADIEAVEPAFLPASFERREPPQPV